VAAGVGGAIFYLVGGSRQQDPDNTTSPPSIRDAGATPRDAGTSTASGPVASPADAAVIAPPLADDAPRPNESAAVLGRRIAARKRYQAFVAEAKLDEDSERRLRAFLYAYQSQFFAARVANIMGTSDAGTVAEQLRGYKALDARAMAALKQLLPPDTYALFMSTFRHPRALIVHKFFAAPKKAAGP
jgi:hypothetical protein